MVSFDPCSSGLTGEYAILVDIFFRSFHLSIMQYLSAGRDEEKKMGTLVKEDFGRPDRASTMVSQFDIHCSYFYGDCCKWSVNTWGFCFRVCDMVLMRNWMMMVLHLL